MRRRRDKYLVVMLRVVAAVELAALPAVVMPHVWMDAVHRVLALGELPAIPIVGYLARSLSAFYVFHGVVTIALTCDVPRYRGMIQLWGATLLALGLTLLAVDLAVGMPAFWLLVEGPFVICYGVAILWLNRGG